MPDDAKVGPWEVYPPGTGPGDFRPVMVNSDARYDEEVAKAEHILTVRRGSTPVHPLGEFVSKPCYLCDRVDRFKRDVKLRICGRCKKR